MENAVQLLANAMHFVIYFASLNNLKLNATLLLKIIFGSEVQVLASFNDSITGAIMVKGPYGPIPDGHKKAIDYLIRQKKIKVNDNSNEITYTSISLPDITQFSEEKLVILREACSSMCINFTATMLSNYIHNNETWQLAKIGDRIPLVGFWPHKRIIPSPEKMKALSEEAASFKIPQGWSKD